MLFDTPSQTLGIAVVEIKQPWAGHEIHARHWFIPDVFNKHLGITEETVQETAHILYMFMVTKPDIRFKYEQAGSPDQHKPFKVGILFNMRVFASNVCSKVS